MKVSQISSVVPKPVRVAAAIIMGCAILLGPVAAFLHRLAMGVVAGVVIAGGCFFWVTSMEMLAGETCRLSCGH